MNLSEIEKIMSEAGIHSCEICGTPFTPYHGRQKTCGSSECMAEYHRRYVSEYNRKRRRENPEVVRRYGAQKMREYRAKQKAIKKRERQLNEMADRWKKQEELDKKIAEYGIEYGKHSAEKVLATVPKIDVSIERREPNDNVHAEDGRE